MSYFEVQSCGLPVLLEKNEINISRAENYRGDLFAEENIEELRNLIIKFGEMTTEEIEKYNINSRNNILLNFDYSKIAQEFTDIMIEEHNKFK
jgi:hypothetical protein